MSTSTSYKSHVNFTSILIVLLLILSAFGRRPLFGTATDGEVNSSQPCIKPVNETIYPKCGITFREEGSFGQLNATCLEDNVFVISPNRSRPRTAQTKDYSYFTSIFDDALPPYARITCVSSFPTDFDYEGVGALDFFRVWKGQRKNGSNNTTYTINAEVLLTPGATGRYVFHKIDNRDIQTSFFIFSERGSKPYLIGGSRTIPAERINSTTVLIPCISSDLAANITLYSKIHDILWKKVNRTDRSYDRQKGFILNPSVPGDYRCFTKTDDPSTDFVTVRVPEPNAQPSTVPKKVAIEFTSQGAICYSMENRTDIKFSNAYARNPTEIRLLEMCLQRKNQYCGSHSYHQRREGRKLDLTCPKNAPSCLWITDVHPEGIFYCETSVEGDSITQGYFTGLDQKIYTNISSAPLNALIRAEWRPNTTDLKTSTLYEFSCEAVGLLFLKDPFTLSVKYKNGSVEKLADMVWWQGSRSFYLTTDMEEIICSDNLWKNNELIQSGTKITVTEKLCEPEQFKCRSGQCIRETWRCDADKDCADGSDELNCESHRCKTGHFKCNNGLCILADKKCNNKNECVDGSDETKELCGNLTCSVDDFKCSTGQCTPAHFLCDGDKDCFDQSDEDLEHCAKYYPQFTQTRTKVTFTPGSINELVCKIALLPTRLKPSLAWWRRGQNISDPERLWQDNTGLRLSLRFENITLDENGEYTCVATNKLQRVVQVFTVNVNLPGPDMSCKPELLAIECLERGCVYDKDKCINAEDTTIRPTSTSTTEKENRQVETAKPATQESPMMSDEESSSGSGATVGIVLVIIGILGLVLGGFGYRYYTRRNVPAGSARMRDDQEVIFSGI